MWEIQGACSCLVLMQMRPTVVLSESSVVSRQADNCHLIPLPLPCSCHGFLGSLPLSQVSAQERSSLSGWKLTSTECLSKKTALCSLCIHFPKSFIFSFLGGNKSNRGMAGQGPDPNFVPGMLSAPRASHTTFLILRFAFCKRELLFQKWTQGGSLSRKRWKWWFLSHLGKSYHSHFSFS